MSKLGVSVNPNGPKLWYFAYGSNMFSQVLSGRRKVFPTKSIPAKANGYKLAFNLFGFPYIEPSFGNIIKIEDENKLRKGCGELTPLKSKFITDSRDVEGILHYITDEEYYMIRLTEGGQGHEDYGYQDIEIECQTYDGQTIIAHTLMSKSEMPHRGEANPSFRYVNLLRSGAKEFGISESYQSYLDQLPSYTLETKLQAVAKIIMLIFILPLALPILTGFFLAQKFGLQLPLIFVKYMRLINKISWGLHDSFLSPIFGPGE